VIYLSLSASCSISLLTAQQIPFLALKKRIRDLSDHIQYDVVRLFSATTFLPLSVSPTFPYPIPSLPPSPYITLPYLPLLLLFRSLPIISPELPLPNSRPYSPTKVTTLSSRIVKLNLDRSSPGAPKLGIQTFSTYNKPFSGGKK